MLETYQVFYFVAMRGNVSRGIRKTWTFCDIGQSMHLVKSVYGSWDVENKCYSVTREDRDLMSTGRDRSWWYWADVHLATFGKKIDFGGNEKHEG